MKEKKTGLTCGGLARRFLWSRTLALYSLKPTYWALFVPFGPVDDRVSVETRVVFYSEETRLLSVFPTDRGRLRRGTIPHVHRYDCSRGWTGMVDLGNTSSTSYDVSSKSPTDYGLWKEFQVRLFCFRSE